MGVGSPRAKSGMNFKNQPRFLCGRVSGRDDKIANFAHGRIAAAARRRKENRVENLVDGIGDGQRASDCLQHGKVVEIVADVCDRSEIDTERLAVLVQDGNLVIGPDERVPDAQAFASMDDRFGLAGGDHDDLDPGRQDSLDSDPITGIEFAHLAAVVEEVETGIREHAVDIQRQELDTGKAFQNLRAGRV